MIERKPRPAMDPISWTKEDPLPAGRWRGGPIDARMRHRNKHEIWHPGDGNLALVPADGVETLQLDDTDMTLAQLMEAIRPEPGSAAPRLLLGEIDCAGVAASLAVGREVIRFRGIARITIGGYSAYARRR
jgi:hypothetical protein